MNSVKCKSMFFWSIQSNVAPTLVRGAMPRSAAGGASNASEPELFGDPSSYDTVAVVGVGAYGTVYKARDTKNEGQMVALKKVRVALTEDGVPMSTLREISLLKQLDRFEHPNIVRLLDICHGSKLEKEQQLNLFLVFEYVDQDLAQYLERCPPPGLSSETIKDIMVQIFRGVDFLHCNRIVHRDLKPQNVLVSASGQVKLADFGLAKLYDFEMRLTSVVVTLWYRAPEVLLGQTYATPVDIWSCGCIMAELYRKQPLFPGTSEGDQLQRIFEVIGTPPESEWPQTSISYSTFPRQSPANLETIIPEICPRGMELLQKILSFTPDKRISASDALQDPYFEGLPPLEVSPQSNRSTPSLSCSTSDDSGHSAESQPEK